jgi:hypothetical protein
MGHVLRSGLRAQFAKLGRFPAIVRGMQPCFSAVQTAWRRERDSNPRYRSETCKVRRLRKLRGINQFRDSPGDCLLPTRYAKQCGFAKLCRGETLAIVWLKVVTFAVPQAAKLVRM